MKNPKILVIDDEPAILTVAQVSLEILGNWEVLTASTGRDGLKKAKSEKPEVIILDIMMPDLNGLTVLEAIRADPILQNTLVILLTGKGEDWDAYEYHSLNIAGIIAKPFEPLELTPKIAEIYQKSLRGDDFLYKR